MRKVCMDSFTFYAFMQRRVRPCQYLRPGAGHCASIRSIGPVTGARIVIVRRRLPQIFPKPRKPARMVHSC